MDSEPIQRISLGGSDLPCPAPDGLTDQERVFWWDCAVQSMHALLAGSSSMEGGSLRCIDPEVVSRAAYDYADTMVREARRRGK